MTRVDIIATRRRSASPTALCLAGELIRMGRTVAFPTETVYGLGADALNPTAVARIFQAKGRPPSNPVIVHVVRLEDVDRLVVRPSAAFHTLASAFWPGPLTLVAERSAIIPDIVTAGGPTVAIRMPKHEIARQLIELSGRPVAAPSANRSGSISPTTADHVAQSLADRLDLIVDGGPCSAGIESTVVDTTFDKVRILRLGPITRAALESVLGTTVETGPHTSGTARSLASESSNESARVTVPLRSPGMLDRHYAPNTPLRIVPKLDPAYLGDDVGLLTWTGVRTSAVRHAVELPADPIGYATGLYAALHDLDRRHCRVILVEDPPTDPEWAAVRDRLARAAVAES